MKSNMLYKIFSTCQNVFEKTRQLHKQWAIFREPVYKKVYRGAKLSDEQKKQIDNFFIKNYGQKVPYMYHQYNMAYTGNFDVRYFPENLYIPAFEYYMHYNYGYNKILADKNLINVMARAVGIKTPKTLLSRAAGVFRDEQDHIISREKFEEKLSELQNVFIKPTIESHGGAGCLVINMQAGKDTLSGKTTAEIIDMLGYDFVVQERVKCHESLQKLYPHSCNTFRLITYLWKGRLFHTALSLRLGQGKSVVDNASSGGMFIAVDENGKLNKTAFTFLNAQYTQHPDTHISFENYVVPGVPKIIKAAIRLHETIVQVGLVHWDFTLGTDGEPVLIEANLNNGSLWLVQAGHGKGAFGENTAEILRWIAKMKKLSYSQRKCYQYGYMEKQR